MSSDVWFGYAFLLWSQAMLKITLMPKMTSLSTAKNNADAKNDIVVKIGTGPNLVTP